MMIFQKRAVLFFSLAVLFGPTITSCGATITSCGATLTSCGEGSSDSTSFSLETPSLAQTRSAISLNNPYGLVSGQDLGKITLPPCTSSDGSEPDFPITYSVAGLPSWLQFDGSSRELGLVDAAKIPQEAASRVEVTYQCNATADETAADSITFTITDLDGGGIVDGLEFQHAGNPLVANTIGWLSMTPEESGLFGETFGGAEKLPRVLTKVSGVFQMNESADDTADFDSDGATNDKELEAGTNPFVASTAGTFSQGESLSAGTRPISLTVGDFDRDEVLDIAAVNFGTTAAPGNTVSVFLGNGNGGFSSKSDYTTGTTPRSILTADFDNDRDLDLAVANIGPSNTGTTISILLGNGDGTFANKSDYTTETGPRSLTAGDFNKDGNLDLAVTNFGSNNDGTTLSVILGKGDGTFNPKVNYTTGTAPSGIIAGDFDNDADLDLVTANFGLVNGTTISILPGNGDGTFAAKTDLTVGRAPVDLISGDFDSDGNLDLAVTSYSFEGVLSNRVSILLGKGDRSFESEVVYETGAGPFGIITADFDGDGDLDLAVGNSGSNAQPTNTVSLFPGNGDGSFASRTDYSVGEGPRQLAAGDFDADGDLDLGIIQNGMATPGSTILIFINR